MKPLSLALLAGALAPALGAQPQLVVPTTTAPAPAATGRLGAELSGLPQVGGLALKRAVDRVTRDLVWHADEAVAFAAARQSGRPVFWLQALGELDGYT